MWFRTLLDSLKPERSRTPAQQARHGAPRRRPADRRFAIEPLEGRLMLHSVAVSDVAVVEGNDGTKDAVAIVSLSAPRNHAVVTVKYTTAHDSALAGIDYQAVSGKLTFAPGQTSKSIRIPLIGDRLAEADETFFINLRDARHARIADGQGVVTIMDDEPRISINSVAVAEGNLGTTLVTFAVSLSAAYDQAVTVNYGTADGSAMIADNDYVAKLDSLTFAPWETSKTFTIEVRGDTTPEPGEAFHVNLSGASSNALIANGQGIGTIWDDDGWIAPAPEPDPYYDPYGGYYDYGYGYYYDYGYYDSYGGYY